MPRMKSGLGRGLDALIPGDEEKAAGVQQVDVNLIVPNPRQPRQSMDQQALQELADSIKEHGVIQPLIVSEVEPGSEQAAGGADYQLIAGERRLTAARLAGLKTVPVIVREATAQQVLEIALVENVQRADLNPLEEATAFQALVSEFGLSQQEVADRVGKSRVAVANILRLLRLPNRVKALLVDGVLSEGHARALLALDDDDAMSRAAEQVVTRELTVRQTEELVRRLQAVADTAQAVSDEPNAAEDPDISHTRRLEEAFRGALGTKVSLTRGRRGGKLVIHFYSDEELSSIYEHIVGE
jgi:ParB family transcriptional regulator, chromosome partitioning protein